MHTNTSFLRIIFSITAIPLFFMLTGCFHNYYQTKFIDNNTLRQNVETGKYGNRYFILRNGNNAYNMTNLMFSDDKNTLYCHLDSVSSSHSLFLMNEGTGKNRYKNNSAQAPVLKEVHLYIAADSSAHLNNDFAFSLKSSKNRNARKE